MGTEIDSFFEHYGVKGMRRKNTLPEKLTRIARIASGTESKNKNQQEAIKAKLKKIADAIKEQEKKQKEYEDALKEISDSENKESEDDTSSEFIKKHAVSAVKDLVSPENEPAATSNE